MDIQEIIYIKESLTHSISELRKVREKIWGCYDIEEYASDLDDCIDMLIGLSLMIDIECHNLLEIES